MMKSQNDVLKLLFLNLRSMGGKLNLLEKMFIYKNQKLSQLFINFTLFSKSLKC